MESSLFLLLGVVACLFTKPIRARLLSLAQRNKNVEKNGQGCIGSEPLELAEIDGGALTEKNLSVFEHIEKGLKANPDGPAVICSFQPAGSLNSLIPKHQLRESDQIGKKERVDHGFEGPCLTLTFTQLASAAMRLAKGLLAQGATPNTRMVMLIPNSGEYAVLLWMCVLLRVTYVSLDPEMLDISNFTTLKQILRRVRPQLVVAPDADSGKALDVAVSELQLPQPIRLCLSHTQHTKIGGNWYSLADVAMAENPTIDEKALIAAARNDSPSRIHAIMFTSGTSGGEPKGCPQRVANMSHMLHSQAWLLDRGAAAVAVQQPHNSRGIAPAQTLQTWRAGGAVVMTGQTFNVRDAVDAIRQFGATFIVLTPPMVHGMAAELAVRPIDDAHCTVRTIQVGGDAVTKEILGKTAALFPRARVCVNHGMTEGGGGFRWPFFDGDRKTPVGDIPSFGELCPVGTVAPGSVIRIYDPESKAVSRRGELGELHISGASLIAHYLAGRSEDSFYDDSCGRRWFKTGDIAMADRDGLVFILGRSKDMIRRAGVPIMPAAIESSIETFTGAQTVVVATPHHVLGTEPFAVIRETNGKTEAQIKNHVRAVFGSTCALGGLATLEQLRLKDFPMNATHKIVKAEVQRVVLEHLRYRNASHKRVEC